MKTSTQKMSAPRGPWPKGGNSQKWKYAHMHGGRGEGLWSTPTMDTVKKTPEDACVLTCRGRHGLTESWGCITRVRSHMGTCLYTHVHKYGASGKEPARQCRRHKRCRFDPWVGKVPWMRVWQPTPIFLPGESDGRRILVGYGPWDHKESDMTEMT